MPRIELVLNGEARAVDAHEGATLLEVIREGCGVTSPKDGCSPTGQCGCCTVLVDGQAKVACAMPADKAAGRRVVTLEGVDEKSRHVFARAFAVSAAVQCGFCIPAIDLTAARALPGVRAIVGAADVPGQRWQGLIYPDWPLFVAVGEETRYTGDILVAIAADTRQIARRAAELVAVDYEVLEPLTSTAQALAAGAPLLHPENGHADNVLSTSKTKRGDADAALA